jgi:hypothetical protein
MRTRIVAAFALLSFPAQAQTVMDGSDRQFRAIEIEQLRDILGRGQKNPYVVQIHKLIAPHRHAFCGEVNFPDGRGDYQGFTDFYINLLTRETVIPVNGTSSEKAPFRYALLKRCLGV